MNKTLENLQTKAQKTFTDINAVRLLVAMHIAGVIGLSVPYSQNIFTWLVPFNLLANVAIILLFHKTWNKAFLAATSIVMLLGFTVEVIGVDTGDIFGNYWYETTLGYKVLDVPLLIAINWLIVIYTTSAITEEFKIAKPFKVLIASLLTVCLDFLIEPIAIKLDFWDWQGGVIPIQNYVGWFVTALVLHTIWAFSPFEKKNAVAIVLYCCEILFFLILGQIIV